MEINRLINGGNFISRIVDLSVSIEEELKDPLPFSIRYETHEEGAEFGAKLVGVTPDDFPERKGLADACQCKEHCLGDFNLAFC
ncbi:hypothetical protein V7157_03750 [Neobacillus drentensis]|uniref:hypothetical protein n=1 Tax=Neobacillus drentensis TaxID=220684 RepID=UPI002FFFFCAC